MAITLGPRRSFQARLDKRMADLMTRRTCYDFRELLSRSTAAGQAQV
jgi:hypothetical protein